MIGILKPVPESQWPVRCHYPKLRNVWANSYFLVQEFQEEDGVIRLTLAKFTPAGSFARNLPRTMRRAFRHDPLAWPEEERELRRRLDVMTEATGDLSSAEDAAVLQLLLDVVEQIGTITHDRFLYYLTPMMTRRNNAIALITLARLSETVTTEDLYAGIPYKTAEITAALRSLALHTTDPPVSSSPSRIITPPLTVAPNVAAPSDRPPLACKDRDHDDA